MPEKTLATAAVGDRIYFAEGRMSFAVQARNRRYLVCTRPFSLGRPTPTVIYTIVDTQEQVRGPDNQVFCEGYETPALCRARLRQLERGEIEVSFRRRVPLNVRRIGQATNGCRVTGCPRPYYQHGHGCGDGLCAAHYRRKLRGSKAGEAPIRSYVRSGRYAGERRARAARRLSGGRP